MQRIEVYDVEAEKIEKICDANDISAAYLIEMLMDFIDEVKEEYGLL